MLQCSIARWVESGPGGLLELGGFDGDPHLCPVERIIETVVARGLSLFGERALEQREVTARRSIAQHGHLEAVERVQKAATLAQGAGAGFRPTNALKGEKGRDT